MCDVSLYISVLNNNIYELEYHVTIINTCVKIKIKTTIPIIAILIVTIRQGKGSIKVFLK
jgi:hypothetical protein